VSDSLLARIAEALERLSPAPRPAPEFGAAQAFVWRIEPDRLVPVKQVNRVDLGLLVGIDRARDVLLANTVRFAQGHPANNVLLWGARGMGKSSLVKAVLDGGIEGRPDNVVFYATSNRRHLMPREMIENERSSAISPAEAVEEKVSLSDRFGLWLGFHPCGQDDYLAMIRGYCDAYGIEITDADLRAEAIEWQQTRGGRSGRVAWQYFIDLAGRRGISL